MHSTDTHGTNQVNFAILHLFGYQFAPRYKDIYEKVNDALYGFKHPSQYGDMIVKPIRKINADVVIDEWENIQRIMVSLALAPLKTCVLSPSSRHAKRSNDSSDE